MKQEVFFRPIGDFNIKEIPYYASIENEKCIIKKIPYFNSRKDMSFNPKNTSLLFPLYSEEQLYVNGLQDIKKMPYEDFEKMIEIPKVNIEDGFIMLTASDILKYYEDELLPYLGVSFFNIKTKEDDKQKNILKEEQKRIRELEKLK